MSGRGSYPWKFREQSSKINDWYLLDGDDYPISRKKEGHRIVACVNACQGMDDPQAEIEALRHRVTEAEEALMLMAMQYLGDWQRQDWSEIFFDHSFMGAGERTVEYLAKHGYMVDENGAGGRLTPAGATLFGFDVEDES